MKIPISLIKSCNNPKYVSTVLKSLSRCLSYSISMKQTTKLVNANESGIASVISAPLEEPTVPHIPVLLNKVLKTLSLKKNGIYLDLTLGAGGHAREILEFDKSTILYSLDRDPTSEIYASALKEEYLDRFQPMIGKFSDLPELLKQRGIGGNYFSGILMDLGVSSMQFNSPERGFMLSQDGPLDMRMDNGRDPYQPTASDVLFHANEDDIRKIFKIYGQEKHARLFARVIVESRMLFKKLKTTKELAELLSSVVREYERKDKLHRYSHPATKIFQALRIFVNDELNQLDYGIRVAHHYLQLHGILSVISFHSLEDTIVKRHFMGTDLDETPDTIGQASWKNCKSSLSTFSHDELTSLIPKPWQPLSKKVILPSDEEIQQNPRARSAKLRAASKISLTYS